MRAGDSDRVVHETTAATVSGAVISNGSERGSL